MAEKVFIDVGAHGGSTAHGVLEELDLPFDRVISVEPDPSMVAHLEARFVEHIARGAYLVAPVAIADRNGSMTLFGSNAGGGASLIPAKVPRGERSGVEIPVVDWPTFLRRYALDDAELYVKINCEGAEVMIVQSIVEQGGGQIRSLAIDYDIVKAPFGGWKKWRSVRSLKRAGIPYLLTESVFVKGARRSGLDNWLRAFPELSAPPAPREPINLHQFIRVKYLELVSALGIRPDLFKLRWRKRVVDEPQKSRPLS